MILLRTILVALMLPITVHAASVQYATSQGTANPGAQGIIAVSDIILGNTTYRVDFLYGSPIGLYGFDRADGSFERTPFSFGKEALTRSVLQTAANAMAAQSVRNYIARDPDGTRVFPGGTDLVTAGLNFRAPVSAFEGGDPSRFILQAVSGNFNATNPLNPSTSALTNLSDGVPVIMADITVAPIPLPASMLMLSAALAGLGVAGFRRRSI